jgi:hypothetical protein
MAREAKQSPDRRGGEPRRRSRAEGYDSARFFQLKRITEGFRIMAAPKQDQPIDEWFRRVDRYGLPLVILALMVSALGVFGFWAKPIIEHVATKQVEFIEQQAKSNNDNATANAITTEILRATQSTLDNLKDKTQTIDERVRDIHGQIVRRGKIVVGETATQQNQSE